MKKKLCATDISKAAKKIYTGGNWLRRQMIYGRPYICPFEEIIMRIQPGTRIMDAGCGDGLLLNLLVYFGIAADARGFDTNETAIDNAVLAQKTLKDGNRLKFNKWSVGEAWSTGTFDVVSMIDVMHHVPVSERKSIIHRAAHHINLGGIFIYKDIGLRPRWRAFANSLHDFVLTGEWVTYTPLAEVVSWAREAGLREREKLSINRLWYKHEMVIFSK